MSVLNTGLGLLIGSITALMPLAARVQETGRAVQLQPGSSRPAAQATRVALVIGNGAYAEAPLRNPASDARAMKEALEACRFEVTLLTDAPKRTMEDAIRAFGDRIRNGAVGLFYYAGHGLQLEGSNFLIPIGARLDKAGDVPYEGVDVGRVLDGMEAAGNQLNILILDACRNNPFALAKGWRSPGERGLAQVKAPTGSLIAYATAPGSVAADGAGEHGLYTQALLEELREPGLKLEEAFKKVREKVLEASKGGQTPWESNSTVGDFFFRPLVKPGAGPSEAELEATYWDGIQNSREASDFDSFLQRFPGGAHAGLAGIKRKILRAPAPVLLDSQAEPWKALKRDPLETREEYAARLAALGPVRVGTAVVSVDNYDPDTGRLNLPLQADAWAGPYFPAGRVVVVLDRPQVRQLLAAGASVEVVARFELKDGQVGAAGTTLLSSLGSFTAPPEAPPEPGAVKNAQGLWEADINLGGCRVRMVLIPAGSFMMGSASGGDAGPVHPVRISHDFWLGKYVVTQGQWQTVMGANPSLARGDDLPVVMVSWDDCQRFIQKLATGPGMAFRLPTEAEWEYACRAGSTGDRYGPLDAIAWYRKGGFFSMDGGYWDLHPVGQKQPNAWGLYDMLGNVWQWCRDFHGDYPGGPVTDPQGAAAGSERVARGGSFHESAARIGSALRDHKAPGTQVLNLGFRLFRTVRQ